MEVAGVRRKIDMGLLDDDPAKPGDWVLIHVGFAMSKISEDDAIDQMRILAMLGESEAAMEEIEGYGLGETEADAMKFVDEFRAPELVTQDCRGDSRASPIPTAITASWRCAAAILTPSTALG